MFFFFFFFNDTATTEIYTLSLHDALPISFYAAAIGVMFLLFTASGAAGALPDETESGTLDRVLSSRVTMTDRKSTRLNSSHSQISYAVFCLKKKKKNPTTSDTQQIRRRIR